MSSNHSTRESTIGYPEEFYDTRVNLSYVFAKLTTILDDAPYNYTDSVKNIHSTLTLLSLLATLIKSDNRFKKSFLNYLRPRMTKLLDKVVIKSVLDSIIIEKWKINDFTISDWKVIEHFLSEIYLHIEYTGYQVPLGKLLEILDRLNIICVQHMKVVPCVIGKGILKSKNIREEEEELGIYKDDELMAGIEKIVNYYLLCCTKNVQVLEYLSSKYLNNDFRSVRKYRQILMYIVQWYEEILKNPSVVKSDGLDKIEVLRDKLIDIDGKHVLTTQVMTIVIHLNKLLMIIKYFEKLSPTISALEEIMSASAPSPISISVNEVLNDLASPISTSQPHKKKFNFTKFKSMFKRKELEGYSTGDLNDGSRSNI